jgi:hypothetical protein
MVAFLDIGLLGYFRVIFTMILIFVIIYGLLTWTKPFGDSGNGLYALIAVAFAVLSITSTSVLTLVTFMTPWFFVVIFVGFFILFMLMIFGLKDKDLSAGKTPQLRTWVIIITIVILVFGLGSAFGQKTLEQGSGTSGTTTTSTTSNVSGLGGVGGTGIGTTNATGTPESTASGSYQSNTLNTLVNPQVLGFIAIMLIAVFTVFLLTSGGL